MGRLQHIAQVALQPKLAAGAVVRAVDENAPLRGLVEAADQVDDGALAAAGFAHQRHGLPVIDVQVEVLQHLLAVLVAEGHVLKVNVTNELGPVFLLRVEVVAKDSLHLGGIHNVRLGFQQADDALRRRLGGLHFRKDTGNVAHRLEELHGIVDKHLQGTDGHAGLRYRGSQHLVAALPQHIGRGQAAQGHHDGQEQRRQRGRANGRVAHVPGHLVELLHVHVFPHKGLGGFRAVDALVEAGGNLAVALAHLAVGVEDALLELPGNHRQGRQHQQHHQGQPPVEGEHLHRAGHQEHRAPAQVHQRPAHRVAQALGVVGEPAHEIAHGHAVVVGKGQLLQLFEAQLADEVAHAGLHIAALADEAEDGAHLDAQQQHIDG